jgi:D-alanyl-D-alanine carboxypeptidase/D-alanyl-D-alanine-endopeptidase (penicillin-binding protein 4)
VWSEPLSDILVYANRYSDNFVAEMLLKRIGATVSEAGTTAAGAEAVMETMRAAGVPMDGVAIVDGSGLSSLDRLTTAALVGVLEASLSDPAIRETFLASLAVAGRSGTLRERLYPLQDRLLGKTGTTDLSCSLSGVIDGSIAFSVIETGDPVKSWPSRAAQDRFVLALSG